MYQYIPAKIRDCVETTKWVGYIHEGILQGGRKVRIFLTVPKGTKSSSQLRVYLHYVTVWLQFASTIAKSQCAEELSVYLLLTDSKKRIPSDDDELVDTVHAKTAFTTSCSTQNEIFLYRREEWFKVFIHESFHNLGLDFSSHSDHGRKLLSEIFAVKSEFRLYETYTEMWAELLNIILIHAMSGKTYNKGFIEKDIQAEREFSLYQAAKVLTRGPHTCWEERFVNYKENTEAFCYYFLKSVLMYNCNNFIEWVSDNNKPVRTNEEMDQKIEKFINDFLHKPSSIKR
jgi:hypothetical protein